MLIINKKTKFKNSTLIKIVIFLLNINNFISYKEFRKKEIY